MNTIYDVMADSPYLTFFAIIMVIPSAFGCIRFIYNATLKYCVLALRGWPPQHLDANGSFKPLPQPINKAQK